MLRFSYWPPPRSSLHVHLANPQLPGRNFSRIWPLWGANQEDALQLEEQLRILLVNANNFVWLYDWNLDLLISVGSLIEIWVYNFSWLYHLVCIYCFIWLYYSILVLLFHLAWYSYHLYVTFLSYCCMFHLRLAVLSFEGIISFGCVCIHSNSNKLAIVSLARDEERMLWYSLCCVVRLHRHSLSLCQMRHHFHPLSSPIVS